MVLAGRACDCSNKTGENGLKVEAGNNTLGTDDGADGGSIIGTTDKTQDPRTYGTSSGGMGYRNDTLDEYDGIDGSARDKGDIDDVPNPK